jgi:hypothetical protein
MPESISPEIPQLRPPAPPGIYPLLLGLSLLAFGAYMALGGFGVVRLPEHVLMPYWVVGVTGLSIIFACFMLFEQIVRGYLGNRSPGGGHGASDWPWFRDYPWDASGYTYSPAGQCRYLFIGVCFFAAFLTPFNWIALFHRDRELGFQLGVALFDLILLGICYAFIRQFLRYLKYGKSQIAFAGFPYAPGKLARFSFSPNRFAALKVTLRFLEGTYEVGRDSDGEEKTICTYLMHWSETQTLQPPSSAREVPIEFMLPNEAAWFTDFSDGTHIYYWEVLVESTQPGIDFRAGFLLPVYDCRNEDAIFRSRPAIPPRRFPLAYTLGFPFVLLLVLGGLWLAPPAPLHNIAVLLQRTWAMSRVPDLITRVPGIHSAMEVQRAVDGRVWAMSTYDVVRLVRDEKETLMDMARFKSLFGEAASFSALLLTTANEAWIGSWHGSLFHYQNNQWQLDSAQGEPLRKQIKALAMENGMLYLAGEEGLWQRTPEGKLERVKGASVLGAVNALAGDGRGTLYVAFRRDLWRLRDRSWKMLWEGNAMDYEISALKLSPDGSIWVGTHNGVYQLDAAGKSHSHQLVGDWVSAILPHESALWVGTWMNGLRMQYHGQWNSVDETLGLPPDSITTLAMDAQGQLWLALYGGGIYRFDAPTLLDRLP